MPSRPMSAEDLLAGAREAALVAGRHAEEADAGRELPRPAAEALVAAGFARHFVPAHRGGSAGTATDLLRAVAEVGQGCTSAAWCASVIAGAARMGAYLPEEGQEALWAEGPDTVVVGALMPRGSAVPVPGGWRVTGEWSYTSAVGFSEWALVCALVPRGETREPWFFALPRRDYEVKRTWSPVGMCGTGSDTLVVDGAFVPDAYGFPRERMATGGSVGSDARCHTAPLRLLSGIVFGAPALGAARAALRVWARGQASAGPVQVPGQSPGQNPAQDPVPRTLLARATIAVDAAGLLLERAAHLADAPAATRVELARSPAECALAVEQLVDVVERLVRASGSSSQLAGHPLQRIWRDVHGLASHVALRFDPPGGAYGALLLESSGTVPAP
ncbi:acyl-CoA dehydrogenase family protein [Streptomyces sp. NPDC089799]|uniref:acyl-CoA dehydrogenase family protein n=1 Tax=Streptomyces sp. NPDC089799 TaxID=3155066 RepID=UPI003423B767